LSILTGPNIFLNICLSKIRRLFSYFVVKIIIIIIIIIIYVAIPADRNVVQKEAEKKLKYKSLCIEIQRMWNLKCTIILTYLLHGAESFLRS